MTISFRFKENKNFETRQNEAIRIKQKYPDRIPVIVEKLHSAKNIPDIDKNKYLVPNDLTIGQFIHVIRKRIKLNNSEAIFVFVNGNILPRTTELVYELYSNYCDPDGFLYLIYSSENTFGL